MALERLQKVLARAGLAARRKAELLITAGRVRVDGVVVSELGAKADARRQKVEVDGRPHSSRESLLRGASQASGHGDHCE